MARAITTEAAKPLNSSGSTGGVYQVGSDGKAPTGLKAGDQVVTGGGTYTISGVNSDGSYQSALTNAGQTTKNYSGSYTGSGSSSSSGSGSSYSSALSGNVYQVGSDGKAPTGLKAGDQVVTGGGTYTINGVNADGSYNSALSNSNQTTKNYSGTYANAVTGANNAVTASSVAATGNVYRVGTDGKAPQGLKVGDQVVTGGGTFTITGVNADGTYQSALSNAAQTSANYTGGYAVNPMMNANGQYVNPNTYSAPTYDVSGYTMFTDANGNRQQGVFTQDAAYYNTIQQMQFNSYKWHVLDMYGDEEGKKKLADANLALGASIGAVRDNNGVWYDANGNLLFSTQQENGYLTGYNQFADNFFSDALAQNQDNMHAQLDYQQALSDYSKQQLNQSYDDLARQLYIDRRMNEKKLPEQMSAMGYTGGLTESSALALATAYEQGLLDNESKRNNALSDIDMDQAGNALQIQLAAAEAAQNLGLSQLSTYQQILSMLQSDDQFNKTYAQTEKNNQISNAIAALTYKDTKAATEKAANLDLATSKAELLASMGDYSGYMDPIFGDYAFTQEEVDALKLFFQQKMALSGGGSFYGSSGRGYGSSYGSSYGSGSSGSGSSYSSSNLTPEQVVTFNRGQGPVSQAGAEKYIASQGGTGSSSKDIATGISSLNGVNALNGSGKSPTLTSALNSGLDKIAALFKK